ncbi:Predicted transcriptional regulator YheO, contains PAS and DNA-binding HTH domains [Rhodoferax sp. OV413]|uniref:helix-turn-helix transcriptional regulator n=1 Tax=Rhodoferax sp. OV413 TaxID=1855285 RepID=UPI00088EA458|nr:PAS domain-containing protein [Rhodoferax sp. OV413]SDP90419.1 Predicted transcriptional regulator YheO, contains PAS and DNA-binding HTH domains [Rhodoferax sp. OV413]
MQPSANQHLFTQLQLIAEGLGKTFAPFCEVVVHDLTHPKNAILAIENNLSGRNIGLPATELGLARIQDPDYPAVIANYANQFADGRKVKSTSIGIKNEAGDYVAALCLNVDLTLFGGIQAAMAQFTAIESSAVTETLDAAYADRIRQTIDDFAAARATTSRALKPADRKQLVQDIKRAGYLEIRRGAEIAAAHLGVSRATVYNDAK